ncbi:myocardin [Acanthochromis polyacanthus]|uniref:myocardin n=1 Tax=Acanthochromis polyacanthus TaxID=80966 RepID=UPI00223497B7|nr:myocardin [Acanthochromis polyacanthus]
MTLLASERSLLIRNKFRSVLQLRIQNRRLSEINADSGVKSSCPQKSEKDQSEALRPVDDSQTSPPGGSGSEASQGEFWPSAPFVFVLFLLPRGLHVGPRGRRSPGRPWTSILLDLQILSSSSVNSVSPAAAFSFCSAPPTFLTSSVSSGPASFPDVFEDDISSSSSSSSPTEHQSQAFPSLPGLPGDQLLSSAVAPPLNLSPTQSGLALLPATEGIRQPLSVTLGEPNAMATPGRPNHGMYLTCQTTPLLPKTARPSSPSCPSALTPSLNFNHLPRPRKPRDTKPKMRKLKYHQYIPPDQRGGSGTGGGGAKQKSPAPSQPLDPAYSHLLKQQQVILQLQILQNQQQQKQQQQQRVQPQQQPSPQQQQQQVTAAPSGDLGDPGKSSGLTPLNVQSVSSTTHQTPDMNPTSKPELLPANLVDLTVSELRQQLRKRGLPVSGTKPALLQRLRPFQLPPACLAPAPLCQLGVGPDPLVQSPCSGSSSGPDSPDQQLYAPQDRAVPNGILGDAPHRILTSVSLAGERGGLANAVFLAPVSGASSPSLPVSSSSPLQGLTPWRSEEDQQQQELEMRERIRTRPRERSAQPGSESCGGSLHPFLQQDPGCSRGKPEPPAEVLQVDKTSAFLQHVFCCQPCDVIGHDLELPVQITASPAQALPGVRSLEEELQEAIQKAQMDPRQSIDDILDEPMACVGSVSVCDQKSSSDLPPPPPADQNQNRDETFLPSPLCSSLLLELPPSPAVINPSQVLPAPPPPPPICSSPPPPSVGKSRKRRAPAPFDAADWLETLTSGLRPLTPPTAPFVEPDFSLDSDLNVNRVLDLMIEQW